MSIGRCFPRPAALAAAGVAVPGSPLRLRDLAALECWLEAASPRPDAGLDPDAPDYHARLRAAYDAAERWPPELDSPEGNALVFGTPEGRAVLLALVLRDSGLAADDVRTLADAMTEGEFAAVCRVAFSRDPSPFAELSLLVDHAAGVGPFAPRESGVPVSWARAIAEECGEDPSRWEAIGDMTLGQWRLYRTGGEPWERHDPLPEGAGDTARIQALRAAWWAGGDGSEFQAVDGPRDFPSPLGRDVQDGGGLPPLGLGDGGPPLDGPGPQGGQQALDEDAQRPEGGAEQ